MRKQRPLVRLNKENPRKWLMGALDIETSALDGDFLYGTAQHEITAIGERSAVAGYDTCEKLLNHLFDYNAKRMRWYAHNAEFDLKFLIDEGKKWLADGRLKSIIPYCRGINKFYKVDFISDEQIVSVYDSFALFGYSLRVFAESFSSIGSKLDLDFNNETFNILNPKHIEYALNDTSILLDSMVNFNESVFSIFGVNVKGTISSTSLAAFERLIPEGHIYFRLGKAVEEMAREAYSGGIVFLTDTLHHENVVSLDINSTYPYHMREFGIPCGTPYLTETLVKNRIGIYRVEVTVPENLSFGMLGYRDSKGVCWARGSFETSVFSNEIEKAIELGYEIKILFGLVFPFVEYPFKDFVDICETQRKKFKKQPFEIVIKLIQNSLYGKFATKTTGEEYIINLEQPEGYSQAFEMETGQAIADLYVKQTERNAHYMLPHWAGYITANSRLTLINAVIASGFTVIYGDTDSIKLEIDNAKKLIDSGLIDVGADNYGQFKIDAFYTSFKSHAPKVYTYVDEHGHYGGALKGIPKHKITQEFLTEVNNGFLPTVHYESLESFYKYLKTGNRKVKKQFRRVTDINNSPNWFVNNNSVKSCKILKGVKMKC